MISFLNISGQIELKCSASLKNVLEKCMEKTSKTIKTITKKLKNIFSTDTSPTKKTHKTDHLTEWKKVNQNYQIEEIFKKWETFINRLVNLCTFFSCVKWPAKQKINWRAESQSLTTYECFIAVKQAKRDQRCKETQFCGFKSLYFSYTFLENFVRQHFDGENFRTSVLAILLAIVFWNSKSEKLNVQKTLFSSWLQWDFFPEINCLTFKIRRLLSCQHYRNAGTTFITLRFFSLNLEKVFKNN